MRIRQVPSRAGSHEPLRCTRTTGVEMPKALVVGALGVVGRANVEYLTSLPDWDVVAISRRAPDFDTRAKFVSADLTKPEDCHAALKGHSDISRVIFAALHEQPSLVSGWTEADHIRVNLAIRMWR
jgi:nucleoside-diphosphate-sugar epimerase